MFFIVHKLLYNFFFFIYLGLHNSQSNSNNETEFETMKVIQTTTVVEGNRQKLGKRVRFAIEENVIHNYKNYQRISESSEDSSKDCCMNEKCSKNVKLKESVIFPTKLFDNDRIHDKDINYLDCPSNCIKFDLNISQD